MACIQPFEFNMVISRSIYEGNSRNPLIAAAQKVATYSIIPLALIAFFEAVVKNLLVFNVANLGITLLNTAHSAIRSVR